MSRQLVRTKEGTHYLNELYPRQDLTDEDTIDLSILAWAGGPSVKRRSGNREFPLIPEKLTHQESKDSVRRLFEAGYLEYREEAE